MPTQPSLPLCKPSSRGESWNGRRAPAAPQTAAGWQRCSQDAEWPLGHPWLPLGPVRGGTQLLAGRRGCLGRDVPWQRVFPSSEISEGQHPECPRR